MIESLDKLPASQQDTEITLALTNLLTVNDGDFRNLWQNRKFIFAFPRLASYLIGSKGRAEFSENQRAGLFALSLQTFLFNKGRKLSGGYAFTKDGEVGSRNKDERTDSFTSALTASILLIDMSLPDKKRQRSLLIDSYKNLSASRKDAFIDTLGRMLAQDNAIRIWIKEEKIDTDNGFDWDKELSQLLFFGIYASSTEHLRIPQEMRQNTLGGFSLEARKVILNFALEYVEKLKKSSSTILTEFILQMKKMEMTEDMEQKLDDLEQKVEFKMAIA